MMCKRMNSVRFINNLNFNFYAMFSSFFSVYAYFGVVDDLFKQALYEADFIYKRTLVLTIFAVST